MGGALDPAVATGRNLVRDALADLADGCHVVIGVSGGADSLALAAVTAFVADRASLDLSAVVVNHGLQHGSDEVADRAVQQLDGLGVRAVVRRVDVGRDGGPEAAARTARREVLAASGADAVLLAHTLDDQAETVLLGLGRGSGPRSIAGMAARDGLWRRPFLSLRRAGTEQICRAHGLTWWTDPHNSDPAFRRSRVRGEVMPLLEGHADVVMDGVGPEVIPSVAEIRRKFTERRAGSSPFDRVLRRLLGVDAKMRQYRDGATFVREVNEMVGLSGFNQVWAEPANLPGKAEILDPAAWVKRVHG